MQVAELGSLSRAATATGLSKAAASRHLAALEERLAARLVQRNTRHLHLTDVGDAFYRRCKPLLIELRQERAATLLAEATRLYNSAQLDSAQAVLNEAFDLDPGNRERFLRILFQELSNRN